VNFLYTEEAFTDVVKFLNSFSFIGELLVPTESHNLGRLKTILSKDHILDIT